MIDLLRIHVLSILFVAFCGTAAAAWGPWSVSEEHPVLLTAADRGSAESSVREPSVHPIAATPFLWSIRFFQVFISPVDGDRCPMYPTCSAYGMQALREHGPIIGIIMTSDRIIHELDEQRHAPLLKVGNRFRYEDPLRNNDFWWYQR